MTTDEQFDRIGANLAELKEFVSELKGSVSDLKDSVSELKESVSVLKGSVSNLKDSIAHLTQYVLDFRTETATHFEIIDNRLDVMAAHLNNIEARYPIFSKAIHDFGKRANDLNNDQAANKHAIAELAEKVSKLHPAA